MRIAAGLLAAATLAGCGTIAHWMDARRARKGPYAIVSPAVAFEIMRDAPLVFVLDLRSPEAFQGPYGHVRNAFNIPLGRLPYRLLEMRAYNRETFLVYCDTADCGLAGMKVLKDSGFTDAVLIRGGIGGWLCGGFATFVRTGTVIPANAKVRKRKNVELEPDSNQTQYELQVIPPPLAQSCGNG